MKKIVLAVLAVCALFVAQAKPLSPKETIQKAHDEKVITDEQKEQLTLLFDWKNQEVRSLKAKGLLQDTPEKKAHDKEFQSKMKEILDAETLKKFNIIRANKTADGGNN